MEAAPFLAHARVFRSPSFPYTIPISDKEFGFRARYQADPANLILLSEKARLAVAPPKVKKFTPRVAKVVDWGRTVDCFCSTKSAISAVDWLEAPQSNHLATKKNGSRLVSMFLCKLSSAGVISRSSTVNPARKVTAEWTSRHGASYCLSDCSKRTAIVPHCLGENVSPVCGSDDSDQNLFSDGASTEYAHSTSNSSRPSDLGWLAGFGEIDWVEVIFKLKRNEMVWKVPWTGQTIFQVMILWFGAFWFMGSWVIPFMAEVTNFSKHTLSFRGQALYSLITDITEGTMGVWILHSCLAQFQPLPSGWFPFHWQGRWFVEAFVASLLFPIVNCLSQLNLELMPFSVPAVSSQVEQSMMSKDPVVTLLYAMVLSVCAPIWEEVLFRGFLLPSLTRYLPLSGAIFVSALAFALAHFSIQRMLPLTFLGLVMGLVFVRSRNLLASILLHSLWNGFAFLELLR